MSHAQTSALNLIGRIFNITPSELSILLEEEISDIDAWLRGEPIPSHLIPEMAMQLNVPAWTLQDDGMKNLEAKNFKLISNETSFPDEEHLNRYWGNIGLRAPGMENSIWMSISEDEQAAFVADASSDTIGHHVLEGMGMNSFIIFPDRMHSAKLVHMDADVIIDDWNISPEDPVDGLPVSFLSLLSSSEVLDCPAQFLNAKPGFDFLTYLDICGGHDRVEELSCSIDVYFTNGQCETFFINWMDMDFARTIHNLKYPNEAGAGTGATPQMIPVTSDGSQFLLMSKSISMIRFPTILFQPGSLE
jgi:hypothetical protein